MSQIKPLTLRQEIQLLFKLAGKKSVSCAVVAALGSVLVAGVEAAVAVFLQFFLKALGLLPTATTGWTWLSEITLSPVQLAVLLGGIGLVRGAANVVVAQCIIVSNEYMVARMRLKLFGSLLLREDAELVEASRLNFIIADVIPKMGLFFGTLTQSLTLLVLIFGVSAAMFFTSWQNSVIGVAGLFFVGLLVLKFNKIVLHASRQLPVEQQNLLSGVQRVGRNWLLVRVLRTGRVEYEGLQIAIQRYYAAVSKSSLWTYIGSESPPTFGIGILIVIVIVQLSYNFTSGGQFLAFLYLFVRFAQYIGQLARAGGVTLSYLPSCKIGIEIFARIEDSLVNNPHQTLAGNVPVCSPATIAQAPEIVFRNVSFQYPGSTSPVIQEFDLKIAAGEHLGIVGQSGAGKTTILGMLLGVLNPSNGDVSIAGMPPQQFFANANQIVGYVGPEAFLLKGTVRDNLCYGLTKSASDKECWESLDQACLGDVIRKNASGLEYFINENGDGLSAGQKQRLSLARALLRKPKLLVLDEASANVDAATENELALVIAGLRGNTTCLIVSHRPGFLVHVDRTISLKAGS